LQEERFHDLSNMSAELVRENYHGQERVKKREAEVLQRWKELLELLEKHKANLTTLCTLMAMLREIETVMLTIKDLEVGLLLSVLVEMTFCKLTVVQLGC
jgi:spectrin beta